MQSSNPVFSRSEGFSPRSSNNVYPASGVSYPAYGAPAPDSQTDPSSWRTGTAGPPGTVDQRRMTIDSVVQKTGITLAVVVLSAAATWFLTGNPVDANGQVDEAVAGRLMMLWMGGAFAGLGIGLVLSFKRRISPPLVIVYAIVEGVFIGAMSKWFETMWPGIVLGAVIGTMAAVAGTLAAYKFFNIQVSDRFRKFVVAASFGFVAVVLLDFVLGLFGAAIGFNGFGTLGLIMSVIGLALGVFMLILDFDFVERGIAAQLPEVESWRAAFGLTVTIIWIYIEILRILAILRGNE